jgi:serine/threonine protein kinase/Tfp pilus assembly protein PilF
MIGQTISHYKILEKLGGGGMGVVYKAEDTKLKRTVALKFLPPELTRDQEAKERFIHEAQAASALQHINICTVHDVDETSEGQLFIVLDCYDGETVKEKIAHGPLKIEDALDVSLQVARGLQKAHEKKIVHRDIKPANIMVTTDGVAKIVDFGLAKLTGRTMLTKTGSTVGTAAYMSPEQARGEQVDQRSDIWSLGVVLYEMLTGKRPFDSDYEQALVYSILNEQPKPMKSIISNIPIQLEAIVGKAIAKKPEERYQNIGEMLAEMEPMDKGRGDVKSRGSRLTTRRALISILTLALFASVGAAIFLMTAHTPEIRKVAVLPFVDMSKDSTMLAVFDGLTEDVIKNIGQLSKATKVISFNGVVHFKDKEVTPVKAGEELGVDAIAICRVYRQANDYSLRLEIVNVLDNTSMSDERFTSSLSDITFLPKRMATSILKTFGLTISEDVAATVGRRQAKNIDAYRLYQQGNYHYHRFSEYDLRKSIEYYRKALAIDSNYALAYAGIALSYSQMADLEIMTTKQASDSAMGDIRKALAIDDKLPEAHLALGVFLDDVKQAIREIRNAIELNPSYADAVHTYAHFLFIYGQPQRGIEMMVRSVELEPLNPHFQYCLGTLYGEAHRWDDCYVALTKLTELDSTFNPKGVRYFFIDFYKIRGDTGTVIRLYRQNIAESKPGSNDYLWNQFLMNDFVDRKLDATKYLHQCEALMGKEAMGPYQLSVAYAVLKDKGKTMHWLETMYEIGDSQLSWVNFDTEYDFLRGNPRFEALMKKAGYRYLIGD